MSSKTRVLEISLRSDIGGGPKHLLDLSKLIKNKIELHIAAPAYGNYSQQLQNVAFKFIELPYRRFSILSFLKILLHCMKHKIQIIHSHGRGAGVYSRLLKFFNFKIIHTFHGIHIEKSLVNKFKLLTDWTLKFFTDYFICVSNSERDLGHTYRLLKHKKTHVIPNGVHVQYFRPIKKQQSTLITLGTLSRLETQKGLDILIEYIGQFTKDEKFPINVQIAGEGRVLSILQEQINKTYGLSKVIHLIGPQPALTFLNSLDIYISFSRWEGLPLAVLEAMSCSLCCLISNVIGNNNLVTHQSNGMLFNLYDYNSFRKNLSEILMNPKLREKLGKHAKAIIEKHFTVEKMTEATLKIYTTALQ